MSDTPRPAGRGLSRFRRSGSLARRLVAIRPIHPIRTLRQRRSGTSVLEAVDLSMAPVSPAPIGAAPSPELADDPDAPPSPIALLPGVATPRRRFFFALANACTVTSILLGMSAIMLAIGGHVDVAAGLLLGCIVADALDGPLARKFGVASPFGAQMDSLADMCSFGIAAPVVVFQWLRGDLPVWLIGGACGLVAVCAAIRLARFNVSPKDGRYFSGVPTTLAATVLALATLLVENPHFEVAAGIAVLALMMVSGFPYAKLAQLRRVPAWLWPLPAIGVVLYPEATFLALVSVYLVSGPVLWAVHRRNKQRAAVA
ncbi:CDP-alcohol phosphatidyltransferase family protein [Stackebrandtia sp.]|uniref:CDP-alcohol phosphatidyltransferase family protein n=1 Tax=Stackebrandtia sp. TaxID=2023065 RepID=UPI0039C96206